MDFGFLFTFFFQNNIIDKNENSRISVDLICKIGESLKLEWQVTNSLRQLLIDKSMAAV
jgi:hypothetical protein